MITIIIPVYNSEKTIQRCINSLKNQTNNNFKVIIINDGSTDQTSQLINDLIFKDERFSYYNQNNMGVSYTRNRGIELCNTSYLSFLDSDDEYHIEFIQKFYDLLQKNSNTDYIAYNFSNNKFKVFTQNFFKLNTLNYLKGIITPNTNCWILKRKLLIDNKISFDLDISWGEDMLFFYKVLYYSTKGIYYNKILTITHDTPGSLSKIDYKNLQDKIIWLNRIKNLDDRVEIHKIVDNYLIPATIINDTSFNQNYIKYNSRSLNLKYVNGLRSIKLLFLYIAKKHWRNK